MSLARLIAAAFADTGSSAATDPYFSNVALLLHMDGANGGTTFTDSSQYARTGTVTAATTSTTSPKWGTARGSFNGTTAKIVYPNSADFAFGTGDFTIEAWVKVTDPATTNSIFKTTTGAAYVGGGGLEVYNNKLYLYHDGGGVGGNTTYPSDGAWHHVAAVRASGVSRVYVDGVGSAPVTNTYNMTLQGGCVGADQFYGEYFGGSIDDLRITKGIARYTNNFTVPSAAFPDTGLTTTYDPFFDDVVLSLHMDGSNGGTTFTDSSTRASTVTAYNATTTTTSPKFGTACGTFNGTTAYLEQTTGANNDFGTGDFTVSTWVNTTSMPTQYPCMVGNQSISGNTTAGMWRLSAGHGGTSKLVFNYTTGSAFVDVMSTTALTGGTWKHVAATRASGVLYLFVDGVQVATASLTQSLSPGQNLWVGRQAHDGANGYFSGQLDDLEITKGIARWVGGTNGVQYFTPPTAANPDTGGYATWNPSDKNASVTLSGGNLTATAAAGTTYFPARASTGKSTGKWYWETTVGSVSAYNMIGVATAAASLANDSYSDANAASIQSSGYYTPGGAAGWSYTNGDVIGLALDADARVLYYYKNNVLQGKAPSIPSSGALYPMLYIGNSVANTANFGQNPLKYTPPNGTFWNPKDCSGTPTFSNNNLTVATPSAQSCVRANVGTATSGKYFEVRVETGSLWLIGVGDGGTLPTYPGSNAGSYSYYTTGVKFNNGGSTAYGNTFTAGDIIGVAVKNGKLYFSKNGTWQNSGDPVAETGFAYSGLSGTLYPLIGSAGSGSAAGTLNTGATPFAYSPPSGYSAWDATVYNAGVY